jgi:hypothetical protein
VQSCLGVGRIDINHVVNIFISLGFTLDSAMMVDKR